MDISISSIAKGDEFENKVFEYISTLLHEDNFIVSGKRSLLYKKKGYYSESRKDNIIVDVSVETFLPDSSEYSFLTIIECKNYKDNVSIDNLEEFVEKLNQIAGKNVKGVFFTTSGFSKQCVNYAKSKGLWLGVFKDGAFDTLTYRNGMFQNEKEVFYATDGCDKTKTLSKLLVRLGIIDTCALKTISVPYISEESLAEQALSFRRRIQNNDFIALKIDVLVKALQNDYGINVKQKKFESSNWTNAPLGAIDVAQKLIFLSADVEDDHRTLFTLAHEIGHWFLHRYYILDDLYSDTVFDESNSSRIEIQANRFASFLLVPEIPLRAITLMAFDKFDNPRKDRLWWDRQPCNMDLAHDILGYLSNCFNVSKEMLIIRMEKNGTLERHMDQGAPQRERNVIST